MALDMRSNNKGGLFQPHLGFAFRDINRDTLALLRPETLGEITRASERKYKVSST